MADAARQARAGDSVCRATAVKAAMATRRTARVSARKSSASETGAMVDSCGLA